MDGGKYIILTKERQADVFIRVCLEDAAAQCRRQRPPRRGAGVGGGGLGGRTWVGKGRKPLGCKWNKNRVNGADFLLV